MKKVLMLLLSLLLVMSMFTGCGKAKDAKTGLSVTTSIAKSTDATADAEGLAEVDSTIVAVLVGADGKILNCKIDAAQTKVNFTTEGVISTDLTTAFKSKQELKTDYGMLKASAIGKEWNEQADAFAKYCVGKTLDQVKGIAVSAEGAAADADLASSVTVHIGDFIAGVAKAVTNAQELGAKEGDKLGLGVATDIAKSTSATAEADGLAQAYSYYTVVTTDAKGKITSNVIDASQGNVNFSAAGVVTSDLTVGPQTKQELKEGYGMKKASAIGKEWYEQANAFAKYATGKTLDQVKGVAVDAEGVATDADLVSSVTVHVGSFVAVIDKAVTSATK